VAANRYSAILDIALSGKSAREVTEILRKTEDIRDVLQSISKTPIALDDGRRANDTYKQLAKSVNDFARGIANGKKQLAATEVGLQRQANALSRVGAQAKIGGALYKNAIEGQVKAEQKLRIAQLDRLKTEQNLFARGKGAFNESFKGVPELIKLGPKVSNTTASLELYRDELSRTLSVVDISSNEFRALENAIAGVNSRLNEASLTGQTSKIKAAAGPATDLSSLSAFKKRETFQKNTTRELTRQAGVEDRIANSQLSQVQKKELLKRLGEATNALAENDLTLARQLSTEVDKYRQSLERNKKGGTTRAGEFSPLTAPKRATNIFKSTELAVEKINTLEAKGTDVTSLRAKAQQLLNKFRNNEVELSLKSLNLADDELLAIRQELKLENQILQTKKQQDKEADKTTKGKKGKKGSNRGLGALTGGLTGLGFPLLMGGPSFSALGGGIGGAVGGMFSTSAGLAGGIIASALGAAVDSFVQKAQSLSAALRSPTENMEELIKVLSITGTESAGLISDLKKLGAAEIAASVATNELNARLEQLGINPERFKEQSKVITNALADLGLAMAALGQKLLPFIVAATNGARAFAGGKNFGPSREFKKQSKAPTNAFSDLAAVSGAAGAARTATAGAFANVKEEAAKNILIKQRLDTENDIVRAKQKDLSIDKLQRATLEGNLKIRKKSRELGTLQARANFEQNENLKRQLNLELQILGLQLRQLQVQKANNEARAAQSIEFEVLGNQQKNFVKEQKNYLQDLKNLGKDVNFIGTLAPGAETNPAIADRRMDLYHDQRDALKELKFAQNKFFDEEVRQVKEMFNLTKNQRIQKITGINLEREAKLSQINAEMRLTEIQATRLFNQRKIVEASVKASFVLKEQELAMAKLTSPLAMFDNFNADNLFQGFGFFTESVNLADEKMLQFNQTMQNFDTQLQGLKDLRVPGIEAAETERLDNQIKQLTGLRDAYAALQPAINQTAIAQARFNDAFNLVNPIIQNAVQNLTELAKGTITAKEAFASMLNSIGQTLAQRGAEMIATYIAIGIAKAFAGMSGGGASSADLQVMDVPTAQADAIAGGGSVAWNTDMPINAGVIKRANGGSARGGQPYMVGERGPELFVPGQSGGVMRNEDMRSLMGRSPASGGAPSMNFSFETTSIGGTEYVSREQLEQAMAATRKQASNDGAKRGMSMTLDKMQNSPRTRTRIGLR
jgi:hypothetical protein